MLGVDVKRQSTVVIGGLALAYALTIPSTAVAQANMRAWSEMREEVVVLDPDEPVRAPEEFELTADEAEDRLVSRLIGERLHFPCEVSRAIEDMLIDREMGAVTHWIVESADESLFSTERRAVPVDQISIEEDSPSTEVELATLDDMQEYDPDFL